MVRTHKFSTGVFNISQDALDGFCESPETYASAPNHREIWINPEAKDMERLETIVHESLHAEFPRMREETVRAAGHNIARSLSNVPRSKKCRIKLSASSPDLDRSQ